MCAIKQIAVAPETWQEISLRGRQLAVFYGGNLQEIPASPCLNLRFYCRLIYHLDSLYDLKDNL